MKNKNVHILEICPFWTCSVKFISGTVRNSGNQSTKLRKNSTQSINQFKENNTIDIG